MSILGCGVAGLVAALSCTYHGQKVDIFERAGVIESAIGGGLGLNGGLLGLTKMGYHSVFKDILQAKNLYAKALLFSRKWKVRIFGHVMQKINVEILKQARRCVAHCP